MTSESSPHKRSHPIKIRNVDIDTFGDQEGDDRGVVKLSGQMKTIEAIAIVQGWIGLVVHEQHDHAQVALSCGPMQWCGVQITTDRVHLGPLRKEILDQLNSIVDGRPMQQSDIFEVALVDIILPTVDKILAEGKVTILCGSNYVLGEFLPKHSNFVFQFQYIGHLIRSD